MNSAAPQAEIVISSPVTQARLLELYTSQGCSSCPPADAWLSRLKSHPDLWTSLVPVGFHVDYWNYIGWKDPFSSPEYSARQRQYAISNDISTVYTPGFLLNGKEWRSFFGARELPTTSNRKTGRLQLKINDMNNVDAIYTPVNAVEETRYILNIAVLGFDIKTEVKAGENRDRRLINDFTVLGYKKVPLYKGDNAHTVTTELPEVIKSVPRMAVSVWVNKTNILTPIQATGGWLN